MQRRLAALLLVCALLLAGCSASLAPPTDGGEPRTGPLLGSPEDRLGWEAGYAYDDPIAVNQSDGLNGSEREALVARTMARVELIRGLEFERSVPVRVVSRETYRENTPFGENRSAAYEAWRNQVWEAALLVGEDRNASAVFGELYGGSVLGYYSPGENRIVVVSDSETPQIDRATLAHELVHALQDQHFDVPGARTRDGGLARQGVTEGDARYVEQLYERRCRAAVGGASGAGNANGSNGNASDSGGGSDSGDANGTDERTAAGDSSDGSDGSAARGWSCVPKPDAGPSSGDDLADRGVFLTVYVPYSDGPALVNRVRERGGREAVNRMYANPPASTEQVIHPEKYPEEDPVSVSVADRSGPEWSRFDLRSSAQTMGEVTLFAMLYQNGAVERDLAADGTPLSPYNYSHPASAGWAGDRVVPYRNEAGENGYVYRIAFDSTADARAFEGAYRTVLTDELAGTVRDDAGGPGQVIRVPDDRPYGDAFRVYRRGNTVTIVNAPSVGELDAVHEPE